MCLSLVNPEPQQKLADWGKILSLEWSSNWNKVDVFQIISNKSIGLFRRCWSTPDIWKDMKYFRRLLIRKNVLGWVIQWRRGAVWWKVIISDYQVGLGVFIFQHYFLQKFIKVLFASSVVWEKNKLKTGSFLIVCFIKQIKLSTILHLISTNLKSKTYCTPVEYSI